METLATVQTDPLTVKDNIKKYDKKYDPSNQLQPTLITILHDRIYKLRDYPVIFGIRVNQGILHRNDIIKVIDNQLILGIVTSILINHKEVNPVGVNDEIIVIVINPVDERSVNPPYRYGKDFDASQQLTVHQ